MNDLPSEQWARLRADPRGDGISEIPSITAGVDTGFGLVRYAIGPVGELRLLIPCGGQAPLLTLTSAAKLSVTLSRLTNGGRSTNYVDLRCIDGRLEHVFAELASDILRRISNGEAPGSSVETTIADFRSLLSNSNDDNVTDQALLGLIGELLVLRKLAGYSPSAVDGWTGPLDQRHDFRRGTFAIEVKTSSRSDARRVTISSIDQLEEPADGTLVLIHVLVEPAAGGSVSVASLFSSLVALGASTHELRERLAKMGCSDPNAATWNRTSFELQGLTGYSVIDGFPRITRSQFKAGQIPSGVSAITYTIELGSLGDFILDPHTFEVELQRVAK